MVPGRSDLTSYMRELSDFPMVVVVIGHIMISGVLHDTSKLTRSLNRRVWNLPRIQLYARSSVVFNRNFKKRYGQRFLDQTQRRFESFSVRHFSLTSA